MIKTIVTATVVAIAMTSSAQACGFLKKAVYGGACSQAEYNEIQKDKAADKFAAGDEEGFYMAGNYAYVDLGEGNVVMMTKSDVIRAYQTGKEEGVVALIGETLTKEHEELLKNDPDFSINPDEDWGEVVGMDKHGNLLDEKSIADFKMGDFDTSHLTTAEIVDIINEDVFTVIDNGVVKTFASEAEANAHYGAVSPDTHPNKEN